MVIGERHREGCGYVWDNRERKGIGEALVIEQVMAGFIEFEVNGRRVEAGARDVYTFTYGEASSYRIAADKCDTVEIRYASFLYPPEGMTAAALRARLGPVFNLPQGAEPSDRFGQLLDAFVGARLTDRFLNSRMSYDFLMSLMSWSARAERLLDREARAREWLLDNYTRPVGIKELAYAMGVSREHLTRTFSQRYGESPGAMLDRLRRARAQQLLRLTHLSLDEVARQSGFGHADTLARHCRRAFGKSPGALRG